MRPRFVAAFERMQFQEHVIRIAVPSEALREEILRNKTELLLRIAETSGVQGMLVARRHDQRRDPGRPARSNS